MTRFIYHSTKESKALPTHRPISYETSRIRLYNLVEIFYKMEKLGSAITIETKATMPMTQPLALDNSKHARILRLDEYKEAAHTLAEAFFADDVAMYFIETGDRVLTPKQKWDLHVSILEKVVYAHCLRGLATTVGPNYDCVALW